MHTLCAIASLFPDFVLNFQHPVPANCQTRPQQLRSAAYQSAACNRFDLSPDCFRCRMRITFMYVQAFTLYEESVADSRQKVTALHAIVGTLHRCYVFNSDNRDALTQSVTSYAAKLLKRADQCRAVCAASHLAWQEANGAEASSSEVKTAATETNGDGQNHGKQAPVRDAQKVMACLRRALKVVAAAKQQCAATARLGKGGAQHLPLYVDIVNHYLYYLNRGVESMSTGVVQQLLELVASELAQYAQDVDTSTRSYWEATESHIQYQKGVDERFAGLSV